MCAMFYFGLIALPRISSNFQHSIQIYFPPVWKRLRLFYSKSNMKQIRSHNKEPEPQMAPADNLEIMGKCAEFMPAKYTE